MNGTITSSEKLSPKKLAGRLGICLRTLCRWIERGEIPKAPHRLNRKCVFWHMEDLPMEILSLMRKAPSSAPTLALAEDLGYHVEKLEPADEVAPCPEAAAPMSAAG